jgi:hypothetical protein
MSKSNFKVWGDFKYWKILYWAEPTSQRLIQPFNRSRQSWARPHPPSHRSPPGGRAHSTTDVSTSGRHPTWPSTNLSWPTLITAHGMAEEPLHHFTTPPHAHAALLYSLFTTPKHHRCHHRSRRSITVEAGQPDRLRPLFEEHLLRARVLDQ